MHDTPDPYPSRKDARPQAFSRRAGIITFHWAHNYGAVLQAYALCHRLRSTLNVDAVVVDFSTPRQRQVNRILPTLRPGPQLSRRAALFFLKLFHYPALHRRKRRFECFLPSSFRFTRPYRTADELRRNPPCLDAIITGSDQVFNSAILSSDELAAYCLAPFSPESRRIAFAPSFGDVRLIAADEQRTMSERLKTFTRLSAREPEGSSLLETMVGIPVPTLIDPVFLLTDAEWRALARQGSIVPEDYILCYALNGRASLHALVQKLHYVTGLPVVLITSNVRSLIKAERTIYDAGPEEFLDLFAHARHVITDSFHGTAYSIIFEKSFYSHIVSSHGGQRIISLLDRLGLSGRLTQTPGEIAPGALDIDYSSPRLNLAAERAAAMTFLRDAICGDAT